MVIRSLGSQKHIGWRAEAMRALTAAVLAVVLLALSYGRAWPLALDIGEHDDRFVNLATNDDPAHGFHAVERFGGDTARWTSGDATIALPRPPDGAGTILSLRLLNNRPSGQLAPLLALDADGQPIGAFEVTHPIAGMRIYRMLIPPGTRLDWATHFGLHVAPITLPADPRPLGVVADQATLAPLGGTWLPPLWLLLAGLMLGALGYALPRSAGIARGPALTAALVLAALVAWGVAARPLELLPFVQRISALLGVGCLGLWVARLLAPPIATTDTSQGAKETRRQRGKEADNSAALSPSLVIASTSRGRWSVVGGRWSVRGADLPIYLAVAWWMGPLFQAIITADGARGVSPPVPTAWIGGVLALGLIALYTWHRPQRRLTTAVAENKEQRTAGDELAQQLTHRALAFLSVAAVAHLGYMLWFAFHRQGPDFWILFKGAREWARGGSLYDLQAIATNHFGHVFKVPPFYGMLFAPFVFQDGERILFFHRVINTLLIGAIALAWLRTWGVRLFSAAGAGVLILLNFRPIADTLAFGQIDLALLLLLILALWALRDKRDVAAGIMLALGTLFKIYPVILLAFFVIKQRWRALAGFALGMLVFNAIAIAIMGWEMHRIYLTEVLPQIGGTTAQDQNQTISGFMARFAAAPADVAIFRDRAITLPATLLSGLVALLGCGLALGAARPQTTAFALQYSVFMLLMVLVVPAAWMHYETLLFIPFGTLLLHLRDRMVVLPRAAALALAFALIAYGNQFSFYTGTVMGILTIAGVSYKFYGMLLLGGVLAATLLEERAPLELPRWLPLPAVVRQMSRRPF
jgi:Glycosyltransferase family 87